MYCKQFLVGKCTVSTVTCIVSKLLQVMYCKYCNVYCKLSYCKKDTIKKNSWSVNKILKYEHFNEKKQKQKSFKRFRFCLTRPQNLESLAQLVFQVLIHFHPLHWYSVFEQNWTIVLGFGLFNCDFVVSNCF